MGSAGPSVMEIEEAQKLDSKRELAWADFMVLYPEFAERHEIFVPDTFGRKLLRYFRSL